MKELSANSPKIISKCLKVSEFREFSDVSKDRIFTVSHFSETFSEFSENHFQMSKSPHISLKFGNSVIFLKIEF